MQSSRALEFYGKHAWVVLFLIWAVHLLLSARDFFPALQDLCLGCLPGAPTPIQASTGLTWNQFASSNPKFAVYLASLLADDGISGVGVAIFGMVVSYTSYRKGEKWAWYIQWSNPVSIAAAQLNLFLLTGSALLTVLAAVFIGICVSALLLPYRQFFPKQPHK